MDEIIKKNNIDCSPENKSYTGTELPALVSQAHMFDAYASIWMTAPLGMAGPMLVLPDARIGEEEPISDGDIAAFRVHEADAGQVHPLPLAQQPPAVGDPVWLATRPQEQSNPQRCFKGVVVEITDRSMVFKHENADDKSKYTSGSPVIDQKGEVVGIGVGGGQLEGQKLAHANHVGNLRRHLKGAL
ncbi:MAG: trypsin-like peptidase domain-containing protein, partial [bacterium]|nr:trypsin-like peptidase domain-containing protein [bacterium]